MRHLTFLCVLFALAGSAAAQDESKPSTLGELIRRCEARLGGGVVDTKTQPERQPEKQPEKPSGEKDTRDELVRAKEAKQLALDLVDGSVTKEQVKDRIAALKRLDIEDVALYVGPLMTGGEHEGWRVKAAYELLQHYAPKVYKGDQTGARMAPYGETHHRYRAWCAARMKNDDDLLAFVRSRASEAINLTRTLSRAESEEHAKKLAKQIKQKGEEVVAETLVKLLIARIEQLDQSNLRESLFIGQQASALFNFYSGIDVDKLQRENRKKGRAGRSWAAIKGAWRDALVEAVKQLKTKAARSQYLKLVSR